MPGARVVKAFNTVFADMLRAKAQGQVVDISVFCAGNDAQARAQVVALASALGFQGIDAGALTNARYLEPLAELAIQLAYGQRRGTRMGGSVWLSSGANWWTSPGSRLRPTVRGGQPDAAREVGSESVESINRPKPGT